VLRLATAGSVEQERLVASSHEVRALASTEGERIVLGSSGIWTGLPRRLVGAAVAASMGALWRVGRADPRKTDLLVMVVNSGAAPMPRPHIPTTSDARLSYCKEPSSLQETHITVLYLPRVAIVWLGALCVCRLTAAFGIAVA
jgi:hypothetical protein